MSDDDNLLDGCDADFTVDPTPDAEADLFVLFAEALDPANPKTVEQAKADWEQVLA